MNGPRGAVLRKQGNGWSDRLRDLAEVHIHWRHCLCKVRGPGHIKIVPLANKVALVLSNLATLRKAWLHATNQLAPLGAFLPLLCRCLSRMRWPKLRLFSALVAPLMASKLRSTDMLKRCRCWREGSVRCVHASKYLDSMGCPVIEPDAARARDTERPNEALSKDRH